MRYLASSASVQPSFCVSTSSSMNVLPEHSATGCLSIQCAASDMMSTDREALSPTSPASILIAAVAIAVRGHRQLKATCPRNSSAMPTAHMLMLYFAIVYATPPSLNHRGSRSNGGERLRTWGFSALRRWGRQSLEVQNVPRALMPCMSAYFLGRMSSVPLLSIAEALLTRMSMPPNSATVATTIRSVASSSRMSTWIGSTARAPASSHSLAAV
mmetsp:Transcript_10908/g.22155  ORF Transcript_10908/g.22155 Transcript_10908/m.22155 type:complete len:214 (-) Transcript_10908:176-817(-)